jgi:hypothetical protein
MTRTEQRGEITRANAMIESIHSRQLIIAAIRQPLDLLPSHVFGYRERTTLPRPAQ